MKMSLWKKILATVMALIPLVVTAAVYRELPEQVPTNWGIDGTITYGPKWTIFILASLNLIFLIMVPLMPKLDPRRANYAKFQKYYDSFLVGLELFMLATWAVMLSEIMNPGHISMQRFVGIAISILFVFIGNMMPKIKNNFFMGIKNPWTLSDDVVWNKTHRLAGFLYVAAGVLTLAATCFFTELVMFWVLLGSVLIATLIPTVMSYLWYRKRAA